MRDIVEQGRIMIGVARYWAAEVGIVPVGGHAQHVSHGAPWWVHGLLRLRDVDKLQRDVRGGERNLVAGCIGQVRGAAV